MVQCVQSKHNYIPYSTFTINKVQLHVSAINVGHLQVVHEALNDKLYLPRKWVYSFVGWGGCEISFAKGVWIGSAYGVLLKYCSCILITIYK